MADRMLDPGNDADYAQILFHKVPVVVEKITGASPSGGIRVGEKRTGVPKVMRVGQPIVLEGTAPATISELEGVHVNDLVGQIALKTKNSVYMAQMADKSKENRKVALLYLRKGYLDFDEKMPDGFYDGGRDTKFEIQGDRLVPRSHREVIMMDSLQDKALEKILKDAHRLCDNIPDLETRIKVLALFVSNTMGGSQVFNHKDSDIEDLCDKEIATLTAGSPEKFLPLGYLTHGVCRHRSVLFKYLADRLRIPSRLVRGDYNSAHAWNVVKLNDKFFVMDVMHDPTQLFEEDSPKAQIYKRKGAGGRHRGGFGGRSVKRVD